MPLLFSLLLMAFFAIVAFGAFVAENHLVHDLRRFRTDIGPRQSPYEGRSIFVQLNVGNSANYSEEAKPGLQKLKRLGQIRMLAMLGLMVVFTVSFVLDY